MQVVTIVGCARSGSTLLEGKLQERFQMTALGEVAHIWRRGFLRDELCGCGERFGACDFWSAVLRDGFGAISASDARENHRIFAAASGALLDGSTTLGYAPHVDRAFSDLAGTLYASAFKIGGSQPLLDSSKSPRFAASLAAASIGQIEPLHVVRCAGGNVYSLRTPKARPQANGSQKMTMLASRTILHAIAHWKLRALQASRVLDWAQAPDNVIFYEAFCADVEQHLIRLRAHLGLKLRNGKAGPWHSVSGNPMRFTESNLLVRSDERWKTGLRPFERTLCELLTGGQQRKLEATARRFMAPHAEAAPAAIRAASVMPV